METSLNKTIGLLTFPIEKSGVTPVSNFIDIMQSISKKIFLITGNDGYDYFKNDNRISVYGLRHQANSNIFKRIFSYGYIQLRIAFTVLKIDRRANPDLWIFFIGADSLLLPMLALRILRKKVFLVLPGSSVESSYFRNDPLTIFNKILISMNYSLSSRIIVYSESLINSWDLTRYKSKINVAHRHIVNLIIFKIIKRYQDRQNIVGYVGRLSGEKGIINFIESIPLILKKKKGIQFIIAGDGALRKKVEDYIILNNLQTNVKLLGWISHDELPVYLNEMKLVVIPSYTEGLPNLMLEAMACGTPVLASKVGSVPDCIIEGSNGFLLENNSSTCIGVSIIKTLEQNNIEQIIETANIYVNTNYNFEKVITKWRDLIATEGYTV